ncbi:MAG: nitrate/nitrite transporter NrtS [Chthoniobacteraceae bacterium]
MTAIIVGFALNVINHGSDILSGHMTRMKIFQMCLTVLVPYVVSTASSVATRNERSSAQSGHG